MPHSVHQCMCHIARSHGTVIGGDERAQPLQERQRKGLAPARGLVERLSVACQHRRSCDDQGGETQGLQVPFHFTFDAAVENARLRVGAHRAHHTAARGARPSSGLRGGQHGAVVDCTEGVLAARRCHGGAQRDVDIVHRRQRRQRRKINGMHHHIPCEGSRRPAPRCMQDVDGWAVKAGCAWGVISG